MTMDTSAYGGPTASPFQRPEPNLAAALAAGTATALAMAVVWAGITAVTNYQIGFMAIGVGIAVGFAVRTAGGGSATPFRLAAALLALAGCLGGNLLVACVVYARAHEVGIERVLEVLDLQLSEFLLVQTFTPMDLLFYGLAVWEAWRSAGTQAEPPPPDATAAIAR